MNPIKFLEMYPVTYGAVIGMAPFISRKVRTMASKFIKGIISSITGSKALLDAVAELTKSVNAVKYQVQTNDGGSLKDAVLRTENGLKTIASNQVRLESYRQHDFWTRPRAGLEMDANGRVNLASEASCRLFKVSDPEELQNHSWLRFLDSHHVSAFMQTFRETAASSSIFRFAISIRAEGGEDRGEWEFKATPIDFEEPKRYSGFFAPVDATAKEIAGRAGWTV